MDCTCGCGKKIIEKRHHKYRPGSRYVHGHNWKGKKRSKESVEKSRQAKIGKPRPDLIGNTFSIGKLINSGSFKKGEHRSPNTEYKKNDIRITGKNNPNFNNYSSFEPYSKDFNKNLKEKIKKRDRYRCQQCFRHQNEGKLFIHHIDYDKKNSHSNNLISLCNSCHSQTNFNREDWISYFQERITEGEIV